MSRQDRFKEAFRYLKNKGRVHTQRDIAEVMGASESNVSAALKGKERFLTENFLCRFAMAFDINPNWLLFDKGEMLLQPIDNIKQQITTTIGDNSVVMKGDNNSNGLQETQALLHGVIKTFSDLLAKSEQRIDSTNQMVNTLSSSVAMLSESINGLKETYIYHIDQVCESRNRAEKISLDLTELLSACRKHNEELMNKLCKLENKNKDNG